jgi:hypothetical protein
MLGERRNRPRISQVTIDFRRDLCRVRIWTAVTLQEFCQIGEPHSGRNAFTGNVSMRHKNLGTAFQERREIPREKARREDLAREL